MAPALRISLTLAAFLLVLWPSLTGGAPAHAQGGQDPVILVIDMQKILRESVAVKAMQKEIDQQSSVYQSELREQEEALRKSDQELARQRSVLSSDAFSQKRQELEQQVASLQRQVQERKRSLEALFKQGMKQVQAALLEVTQQIATEQGATLVLPKTAVVLVSPNMEITGEALKRLNSKLPAVVLSTPQN